MTGSQRSETVLVIGASSGYGLAARISAAFGFGADTLGVFFEMRRASQFLDRFLDSLDDDRRSVFVLSELQQLSAPEVPASLAESVRTGIQGLLGQR